MRVLFWVQQLLGSGHLKRAATLARAMADEGVEVTLLTGGMPMAFALPREVEVVQLPPIRTSDPSFAQLVDAAGRPLGDALWQERQARLQHLLAERRPQVLITEMFPFGRRAFRRELLPLLEAAAAMRPRPWRLCSVRDILVKKPTPESYAWMRDLALAYYDRILVHTDPQLIPFDLTFPFAAALQGRLVDTGYVVDAPAQPTGAVGPPEVLVSAGGGRVGAALLEAAIEARGLTSLAEAPWRLVAGGNLAADRFAALQARLPDGMALDRHRADFDALFANSLLSVSQAGYNTVVEGLRLGKPMVLVPFETASETEQRIRAERLASLGLAEAVWERELAASSLARAIDAAYGRPVTPGPGLDRAAPNLATLNLDGAATTARLVAALARQPAPGMAAR
jgi:predicted glycosyltransferase